MALERSDSELIADFLQTRSEDLFVHLYRKHTPAVYLFILRLTGGLHHDAEDIVQETWIRAVRKLVDFRLESSLRSWLTAIALNCYREFRKRKARMREEPLSNEQIQELPAHDLEQSIRSLPQGCREILILHDLYGFTHEEIAAALNIHSGTSRSQLFEARKRLRATLQKEER